MYSNALTIEAATLLPPLYPSVDIEGILNFLKYSLDSLAPTKPTGTPIINLGLTFPSLTNSNNLKRAVGHCYNNIFIPSSTAKSIVQADLVVSNSLERTYTFWSSIKHFNSQFVLDNAFFY